MRRFVYFDHNASALPDAAAARAAADWLVASSGNPSSVHAGGRNARSAVEHARRAVAASLSVPSAEVVFTSGATEALHLVICGLVAPGQHVLVSAVEHPAVFGALAVAGARVSVVPVDGAGRITPASFRGACQPDTIAAVLMAAQNELGNRYPVAEVARAVAPVPLICDAAQAYGRVPLDPTGDRLAALVISGHKVGAPAGVGAVWLRPGLTLRPYLAGGPQERGRRAGTENASGIVGLGVAAEGLTRRIAQMPAIAALRDRLRTGLSAMPNVVLHGDLEACLPNTVSFRCAGYPGDALLAALDLEGFALSSGAACSSGAIEPSPVLRALGLSEPEARSGLRISLGPENKIEDVDALLGALRRILTRGAVDVLRTEEVARCA